MDLTGGRCSSDLSGPWPDAMKPVEKRVGENWDVPTDEIESH